MHYPFAFYCLICPYSSKDGSTSGSVSGVPRKSKKSKKTTESMIVVYNSVLNSVFGAVSEHSHFGV